MNDLSLELEQLSRMPEAQRTRHTLEVLKELEAYGRLRHCDLELITTGVGLGHLSLVEALTWADALRVGR